MKISKKLYLAGPAHESVYAFGAVCGKTLLETVRHEARKPPNSYPGGMGYYSPYIYSRISYDNGENFRIFDEYREYPFNFKGQHNYGQNFVYDPDNGIIGAFLVQFDYDPDKLHTEKFSDEGCYTRTFRILYRISDDDGRSWSKYKPLICDGFDKQNWGPSLHYGKSGALFSGNPYFFNGKVYLALAVNLHDGKKYQSAVAGGTWDRDKKDWVWSLSDYVSLREDQSSQGACEPALANFGGDNFIMLLRACGDRENHSFPTYKYFVHSSDGCRVFSAPQILRYDDGSEVWCPSSYSQIIRSSANGKYYLITNILDVPTYSSQPRNPLCIAQIIPEQGIVVKESVEIIDCNKDKVAKRRYTNFGLYEDPVSRELVLTMPEQPRTSWDDFSADCYQYRVKVTL